MTRKDPSMLFTTDMLLLCITALSLCFPAHASIAKVVDEYHYDVLKEREVQDTVRIKRQSSFTDSFNTQLGSTTSPATTTPITSSVTEDPTHYYNVGYVSPGEEGADYWIDLDAADPQVVKHKSLQDAYRLAVKINIGFEFLFYGHTVEHVTVATGGFLYMSDFLHSFLTASQYIAPLMANFDTSLGRNESEILFKTDEKGFVVQWSNVYLKDKTHLGAFTFQAQLLKEQGTVITAYKTIPAPISNLTSSEHPVKIGISDAYYWDVGQYRTIYPYHTYNASRDGVESGSAIVYTHLQTCNMIRTCDECLLGIDEKFKCYWCSYLNRCSDSYDRQRQDWIYSGCVFNTTQTECNMMFTTQPPKANDSRKLADQTAGSQTWKAVTAALCTIFALAAASVLAAVIYGYRNPTSTLGQFLVRNRPSELWRKFKAWKDKEDGGQNGMNHMT